MGPLTSGDALDALEIRRASTSDQVADAVRTMILRGQLPPGTQLREVPLAESIGISRNTVREAVRVLARQGLVTHSMHRGAVVTRLTEHDVVDLIRARRTLESQAIEAAGNAAPDELRALDEIILELERAATDGDWDRMVDADWSFHRRLVSFLGSPRLDRFFETIQAEMRLCLSILDREDDDPDELVDEHRELRDLIANRATERCIARLGEHLDDAELRLRLIARSWEEQTKQ